MLTAGVVYVLVSISAALAIPIGDLEGNSTLVTAVAQSGRWVYTFGDDPASLYSVAGLLAVGLVL